MKKFKGCKNVHISLILIIVLKFLYLTKLAFTFSGRYAR